MYCVCHCKHYAGIIVVLHLCCYLNICAVDHAYSKNEYCWWSGIVVSALASINEVNQRWAQLVLRRGSVQVQFPVPDIYFSM